MINFETSNFFVKNDKIFRLQIFFDKNDQFWDFKFFFIKKIFAMSEPGTQGRGAEGVPRGFWGGEWKIFVRNYSGPTRDPLSEKRLINPREVLRGFKWSILRLQIFFKKNVKKKWKNFDFFFTKNIIFYKELPMQNKRQIQSN